MRRKTDETKLLSVALKSAMLIRKEKKTMQEIILKNNTTGLEVYINGKPDLKKIPKDVADTFIYALAGKTEELIQREKREKI